MPFVHDPSTVIESGGRYYVYSTGRGIPMLSSPDLMNWTRLGSVFSEIPERVHAQVPKNNGTDIWAPDILRLGDTFYLYYAVSSWGSFRSVIALATNKTLDPAAPSYRWVDHGVVIGSDGVEEMNDIDPAAILAPDGTLWLCYGSYHGSIKVLQLDPKTGLVQAGASARTPVAVARASEAADILFHDGYFYLFVNHGSCCKGKDSEYNIRVGRARAITGPYLDKHGIALTNGGGSLFLAARDHRIGPGHFARVIEATDEGHKLDHGGMELFSLHYEADLANPGRATLGIRPLLWSADSWPVAGDTLTAGTYQIESQASEDTLEIRAQNTGSPAALQVGPYRAVQSQQWSIQPAGGGCYKVINLETKGALGVDAHKDASLDWVSSFTAAETQLWRLDQLTDGSYRMRNKATDQSLTLMSDGSISLTDFSLDDNHRWLFLSP